MSHIHVIYVTYNSNYIYMIWYIYIYIHTCYMCFIYVVCTSNSWESHRLPARTYLEQSTRSSSSVIRKTVLLGKKLAKECFQALKRDMRVSINGGTPIAEHCNSRREWGGFTTASFWTNPCVTCHVYWIGRRRCLDGFLRGSTKLVSNPY